MGKSDTSNNGLRRPEKVLRIGSVLASVFVQEVTGDDGTRNGPKVQLAGTHHNPTPGPSGSEFLYGHVWVTISWLVTHPRWGCIGMPLLAMRYVRQKDLQVVENIGKAPWTFRTKLELAAQLVEWRVKLF